MWYISNCPTTVWISATFRRYHLEHHTNQGSEYWDMDLPTKWEWEFFNTPARKLLFLFLMPISYGFRPPIVRPKPIGRDEIINWLIVGTFDILVLKYLGFKSFFYLLFGLGLGAGIHPMSGHFIGEHCEFITGQETYSYYGPLNYLCYNVGYHNEHHDFPRVPGRLLPKVKEIAPEYYDMPSYDSWTKVLIGYVLGKNINCYCRVKRKP